MALSVVDLYRTVLPRTNCRECGFKTCIAFAGMVVSEKHPLENCPYILPDLLEKAKKELEAQYKQGKWLKKDMAAEALELAKLKAASMTLTDIAQRIGGTIETRNQLNLIHLPYFNTFLEITADQICDADGNPLSRNEQTFVYIHMAHGGNALPSGKMRSFKEFPNTVSKIISMTDRVEQPLIKAFAQKKSELVHACIQCGGTDVTDRYDSCDLACLFSAFPKVPVTLLYWKEGEGFDAQIKLMFDDTIIQHLDIEAIMFLSEHLANRLIQFQTAR